MRIGNNPNNHKKIELLSKSHRVIIPIYIPNNEGYFADAFNVLKVSIKSLLKTINTDTAITLISNDSSIEVNNYISKLFNDKKIDKAVYNSENIGKMNAIITETRASFEEFITYSDADVFFDKGWLQQTFNMFKNCSNAGFVSMNPTPNNLGYADSTILKNIFPIILNIQKTNSVCTFDDLEHFHKSIGRNKEFTLKMFNEKCYTISQQKYIIGAGHFCCTIRKTPTLKFIPKQKSNIAVSGGSESAYLDIPFDKTGLWRISSPKAYVWHMGNILEKEWAQSKLESLSNYQENEFRFDNLLFKNRTFSSYIMPYKLKIIIVRILKKLFLN